MCHAHTTEDRLQQEVSAIVHSYFQSSVPPQLGLNIHLSIADHVEETTWTGHSQRGTCEDLISYTCRHTVSPHRLYTTLQVKRIMNYTNTHIITIHHRYIVFKHLYYHWQDYQNCNKEKIDSVISKFETQMR